MLRTFSIAMVLSCVVSAESYAQTQQPVPNRGQSNDPHAQTNANRGESMDQMVAACLILANHNEIALAEYAQGRVQDERVKRLVSMLVSDHEKALAKAKQFAPEYALQGLPNRKDGRTSNEGQPGRPNSQRTDTAQVPSSQNNLPQQDDLDRDDPYGNRTDRTVTSDRVPDQFRTGDMGKKWFEIEKNAGEICLQMTKQELDRMSGSKFDKAFVGSQVGGHIHMISKLQAIQPHVSEQMRPFIDECLASTQKHLEEARNLCETMEQSQGQSPRN